MSFELPKQHSKDYMFNYHGKIYTEDQMLNYGQIRADYVAASVKWHYKSKLLALQSMLGDLINDLEIWSPNG